MTDEFDEELFSIMTYLACSAALSLDETPSLAAYRMVDATKRLMALVEGEGHHSKDPFLAQMLEKCQDNMDLVMTNQPMFDIWLSELARNFTLETRRRAFESS
jgi:hypothetical protein